MNPSGHTYFLEQPTNVEVARLVMQARLLREYVPLLPPGFDDTLLPTILDLGCGPGRWALDAAIELPDAQIIGLDQSADMVSYAQVAARSQRLRNVSFQVTDACQRLPFSLDTFDLVHLQFATSWVMDESWLPLLREVRRVLRAGKSIMITESQLPQTNSPALKQLNQFLLALMRQMKLGRCQDNELGVIPALGPLLHQAHFFAVTLQEVEVNFSSMMPATDTRCFENLMALFTQLREQVVREGLASESHYSCLLQQFLQEARREDFFGCSTIYTFMARR